MYTLPEHDNVLAQSIRTILWQAGEITGENGEFTGESYDEVCDADNCHITTQVKIIADFYTFLADVEPEDVVAYLEVRDWSDMIHDYWLTRNHHGVGFWDRGLGDLGHRLTTISQYGGEYNVWHSPDGSDHVDGHTGWFYE